MAIDTPPAHHHTLEHLRPQELKSVVFQSMKQLEGWCSQEKAGYLVDLITLTKPEVVVEIGVWGGKSLIPMAFAVKSNGYGKVYGIDPWETSASAKGMEGENLNWWGTVNHDKVLQSLEQKIRQFKLQEQITLIRTTSEEADPIDEIGLLHIDGNHSEDASYIDVTKWVPHVKKGGIIVFDDMNWGTTNRAVDYLDEHCIPFAEIHGDNVWGVWIKP